MNNAATISREDNVLTVTVDLSKAEHINPIKGCYLTSIGPISVFGTKLIARINVQDTVDTNNINEFVKRMNGISE